MIRFEPLTLTLLIRGALVKPSNIPAQNTQVREADLQGFNAIVLENEHLQATVLPTLGGKIASLANRASGREFLLQPPDRPYSRATYGAPFDQFDTSGFDECFPSVSECQYPEAPFSDVLIPDHGELWSVPWHAEQREGKLCLAMSGIRLPYLFRKELSLRGSTLRIDYEITSVSDAPMAYLYSAHPLLNVEPGATIVLPSGIESLYINSSSDDTLGKHGDTCGWPLAKVHGGTTRLDVLVGRELLTAHKLFTPRVSNGLCGIHFPRTREALVYRFDPVALPYIGLWICQGAWPNADTGHFTVALEPCSGRPDSLVEAISRDEQRVLAPHKTHRWWIEVNALSDCETLTDRI